MPGQLPEPKAKLDPKEKAKAKEEEAKKLKERKVKDESAKKAVYVTPLISLALCMIDSGHIC